MSNQTVNNKSQKKFDLLERTSKFGMQVIDLSKEIPINHITKPIVSQFIRSGTSVGANYCEAEEASSKKDFKNKICIAKKEAKETMYWLEMIVKAEPQLKEKARPIWKEAHELVLIFSAIIRK
jgi:four helix bundle protein